MARVGYRLFECSRGLKSLQWNGVPPIYSFFEISMKSKEQLQTAKVSFIAKEKRKPMDNWVIRGNLEQKDSSDRFQGSRRNV